jgi:hypothetical protein
MKKLLLIWIFSGSLDGFSQTVIDRPRSKFTLEVKDTDGYIYHHGQWHEVRPTLDTIPESMHVSTRKKGLVFAQVALSVRRNGYCIGHLDCNRKPFPVHYKVGWCEGKDEVYKAIVELLNRRR